MEDVNIQLLKRKQKKDELRRRREEVLRRRRERDEGRESAAVAPKFDKFYKDLFAGEPSGERLARSEARNDRSGRNEPQSERLLQREAESPQPMRNSKHNQRPAREGRQNEQPVRERGRSVLTESVPTEPLPSRKRERHRRFALSRRGQPNTSVLIDRLRSKIEAKYSPSASRN